MNTEERTTRLAAAISVTVAKSVFSGGDKKTQGELTKILDVLMFLLGKSSRFAAAGESLMKAQEHISYDKCVRMIDAVSDGTKKMADEYYKEDKAIVDEYLKEVSSKQAVGEEFMPFDEFVKLKTSKENPPGWKLDGDPNMN